MLDHPITIRDVLYVSGISVGVIAAIVVVCVLVAWVRMKREYRSALRDSSDEDN